MYRAADIEAQIRAHREEHPHLAYWQPPCGHAFGKAWVYLDSPGGTVELPLSRGHKATLVSVLDALDDGSARWVEVNWLSWGASLSLDSHERGGRWQYVPSEGWRDRYHDGAGFAVCELRLSDMPLGLLEAMRDIDTDVDGSQSMLDQFLSDCAWSDGDETCAPAGRPPLVEARPDSEGGR